MEDPFSNAFAIRGLFPDGRLYLPKPDLWFGLGLYTDQQVARLEGLELKDKGIEHFCQWVLEIRSTTFTPQSIPWPNDDKKNAAFPWMVVEMRNEFGDINQCLRQAANDSHTCLSICKKLAPSADVFVSPIVALTSIGPEAKLFIAYLSTNSDGAEIYLSPALANYILAEVSDSFCRNTLISECLVYGVAIFSTSYMLCNSDVLLII